MPDFVNLIYSLKNSEDLACKRTFIHRLHPVIKLLTTVAFLVTVVSFEKYETLSLLPLFLYPVIIINFAEIPAAPILKRILLTEPLIIGIGILNPIFDHQTFVFLGVILSAGWIALLSILIKCGLTIVAAVLLMATTGIDRLAMALRMLKIPRILVLQLLLTYRYISVLMEEVARMLRSYRLRSPNQKGIHRSAWGSFAGQLILRTYDRAQRVYQAMCVRGFEGGYNYGKDLKMKPGDFFYLFGWFLFFIAARTYNLPALMGSFLTGVSK